MNTKPLSCLTRKLAAALWLMTLSPALSQPAVQVWVQRYNGPGNNDDQATAIAVDGSGNVLVTGFSSSSGGIGIDYTTIKYSSAGVPLWTNFYNGPGNNEDQATAIAVDGGGNVIVTGYSVGSAGYYDYATIKYSSAGVPLWTNRYDGPANNIDQAYAAAVDGSGNVFVTGYSAGSGSYYDYATIKYSGAGVPLWTNRYNGPGNSHDFATAIAVDGSGNVFVTGWSYAMNGPNNPDYATIKYSSAGLALWTNRYDGPGNGDDEASGVAVDSSGNVFVTGYSEGDYVTIKYSGAGASLWINRYNGPGNGYDYPKAVAVDGSGNVLVTGASVGSSNSLGYATIKYSNDGVPLWTNWYNGPGNDGDSAKSIAVDGSGNVFVTGYSANSSVYPYNYDYATVAYSVSGAAMWTNRYNGPGNNHDYATVIAVDGSGNVFVTGYSTGSGSGTDFATIKYSGTDLLPIPLNYQIVGNQLVLSWTNAAFSLQSAPAVQGDYTNISGATSPYTNAFAGTQQYFRLRGN